MSSDGEPEIHAQTIIKDIAKYLLGYVLIYPASDSQFGRGPAIRRRVYNKRVASDANIDALYRSTNRGRSLDALNPAHCLKIGLGPHILDVQPTTDVRNPPVLSYKSEFHGLVYDAQRKKHSESSLRWFPVLLDGGHRFDVVQKRLHAKTLDVYNNTTDPSEREELEREMKRTVWLCQVYDLRDLINHLTTNKPLFQIRENDENLVLLACDTILHATEGAVEALGFFLTECLDQQNTMNTRIRAGLCNARATQALAELMRFSWHRTVGLKYFSANILFFWHRVALSLISPYMEWAGLSFKILSSTHSLALTAPYPPEAEIDDKRINEVNQEIDQFGQLMAEDQDLSLDFLDDRFFNMISTSYIHHLAPHFHLFGAELGIEAYGHAWTEYEKSIFKGCETWIVERKKDLVEAEDTALLTLIRRLPDRLRWMLRHQVGAGQEFPKAPTNTPLIVPYFVSLLAKKFADHDEGLIQILSQLEPLACYLLRPSQEHSVTRKTYIQILEDLTYRNDNRIPNPVEVKNAVCSYIQVILKHRDLGLDYMRNENGIHPKSNRELQPSYQTDILSRTEEDAKTTVSNLISILRLVVTRGIKKIPDTSWYPLVSSVAPVSRNIVTLILEHTTLPWSSHQYARPGNPNGNNYFRVLGTYIYLVSRCVYTRSAGPKHSGRGFEYTLFRRPEVHSIVDEISQIPLMATDEFYPAFPTWHELGEPDMPAIPVESANVSHQFSTLRHSHIREANSIITDLHKKMLKSDLFSIIPQKSKPRATRVLKRGARKLLHTLIQETKVQLVEVTRHEYASEKDPHPELNEDQISTITSRINLPDWSEQPEPSANEEREFHSLARMKELAEALRKAEVPKIKELEGEQPLLQKPASLESASDNRDRPRRQIQSLTKKLLQLSVGISIQKLLQLSLKTQGSSTLRFTSISYPQFHSKVLVSTKRAPWG
ncbi:hypothetical protein C0993_008520 [Termitomyces sp. T159_Od127]|nr:hypothetical protein C0993_008520 [Termitomyces sp. T159_Od127]